MAERYNEIITLRSMRPAYNIKEEGLGDWKTFITNDLFNSLLKKVVSAVRNNDQDTHKPIWVVGTYGTGKSHAGAVLKHILCDELLEIQKYIDDEYRDEEFAMLKNQIVNLRQEKRLFPVNLYGQQNIAHEADLSLQVQSEIKKALKVAGIELTVKTDFDAYLDHIERDADFWERLIERNAELQSVAPDLNKLKNRLQNADTIVYGYIVNALRDGGFDIRLQSSKLQQWIFEVQNEMKKQGVYDGLLLIWDEFTEVMTSAIGTKLLVQLQEIAEAMMNRENDSYFLFISHPSALNSLNDQEREKTKGRYHYVTYNMEPVSAFKIMTKKFEILNYYLYARRQEKYYNTREHILDKFAQGSKETKRNLRNLFPLHPATANLATYFAREAGSSSRSVFDFLACDRVREFFNDENAYANLMTVTADFLWDYVQEYFESDSARFGAVTERYNSHHLDVENRGLDYIAIFKGVLLLNALNNIANTDTVTPSEENIRSLFEGTLYENSVPEVLEYFNEQSIIQRQPNGNYSILFTALPSNEIQTLKAELRSSQFLYTDQVANFRAGLLVNVATKTIMKWFSSCNRLYEYKIFSLQANEHTLLSKIENEKRKANDWCVFIAFLVARNKMEYDELNTISEKAYKDSRFQNVCFVLIDSLFEDKNYERFIEYQANAACAQRHNLPDQQRTYNKNAEDMLEDWFGRMRNGNAILRLASNASDMFSTILVSRIASTINSIVSPEIFSSGPESLDLIRTRSTTTYWKPVTAKSTVDAILSYNTKQEIIAKIQGQAKHAEWLLQNSVDENLDWKSDIDPEHPLKKVCDYVDEMLSPRHTPRNQAFNLGDKLIGLTKAPFGLFATYAPMAMVAFAMRKYINQLFDVTGKEKTAQHLVDDIVEMFKYWGMQKSSNKLNCMFESLESRVLCNALIGIFQLNKLRNYTDVSSLKDARWAISHDYSVQKGYPLWSLKYYEGVSAELSKLVDDIFVIVSDADKIKDTTLLKQTAKQIDMMKFELGNLLLPNANAFYLGFRNFLKSIQVGSVKDNEIEDVLKYLKEHLQSEVGLWNEVEVKDMVKDWKLSTVAPNPKPITPNEPSGPYSNPIDPMPSTARVSTHELEDKKEKLNKRLDEINPVELKSVIKVICNNANNSLLIDEILKYVSQIQ